MREMKDSGVISIGLIPVNWSVRKFKTLAKLCNGREVNVDEGCVPVYGSGGIFKWTNIPLHSGESLLMGRKGTIDNPMLVKGEFWTVDTMFYTSEFYDIKGKFLYYCCKGTINYGYYKSGSVLPSMTQMEINNVFLPYTTSLEQDKIVNVLDKKCAQIDALIANQQTQIEKLKAYKQSLITEVITKGLDPDVPMKDSGVEWIGMIPEHWEVLKFKHIATVKSNLVDPSQYLDYPQVSPENIEKGSGKLLECKTVRDIGVESNNHLFYRGQILYSKVRPILNKVTIAPFDGLCSADMYPIETAINKKYLIYLMLSNVFLAQVKLVTENRVKMPKINQEEISRIIVCYPSCADQEAIAKFLDSSCSKIDHLISLKQAKIEKLEQYKKSLIYEYVTGKKEANN